VVPGGIPDGGERQACLEEVGGDSDHGLRCAAPERDSMRLLLYAPREGGDRLGGSMKVIAGARVTDVSKGVRDLGQVVVESGEVGERKTVWVCMQGTSMRRVISLYETSSLVVVCGSQEILNACCGLRGGPLVMA
jgi:hypothetical protein